MTEHIKLEKSLYVFLGDGNMEKLPEIKSSVPKKSVLLYISNQDLSIQKPESKDDFTFFASLNDMSDLKEKLWLLSTTLKYTEGCIACDSNLPPSYSTQLENIRKILDEIFMYITHEKAGRMIKLRCAIHNLPAIKNFTGTGLPNLKNLPAIICAAGPSLQNQLPLIKEYSPKAVIIAVGRLEESLVNAGIIPDFVVQVDPDYNSGCRYNISGKSSLVTICNASPEAAKNFKQIIWGKGDSVFFRKIIDALNLELPEFKISKTVTVTAIDFAAMSGCNPITLVGNDLCLAVDGNSHLNGYIDESLYEHKIIKILGNDGKTVVSTSELNNLKSAIESYLSDKKLEVNIFNSTSYGVKIKGAQYLNLEEFAEKYLNKNISKEFFKNEKSEENKEIISFSDHRIFPICQQAVKETVDEVALEMTNGDHDEELARLKDDLLSDLKSDFENLDSSPIVFSAFRNFAIRFVAENNPEFAKLLEDKNLASEKFDLHLNWQNLPLARLKKTDGKFYNLSADFLSMEKKSMEDISQLCSQNNFNPQRHAVVFFAPGNWLHPVNFAAQYPQTSILIVEPWPELFSEMINYAIFTHRLPRNAVVVGIHPELKRWKRIYHSTLREWKKAGKEIIFYQTPETWALPEIQELFKELPD
jgi:hypothetical protein